MAYYKFTWEKLENSSYPIIKVKSLLLDSTEKNFVDQYFPFDSSKKVGNAINNLNDLDIKAVTYKTISNPDKVIYELVVDVTPSITTTMLKLGYNGITDDSNLYIIGESILYPPHDHTILTLCEPIITTTTTTTSTTTTTTVAP